MALLLFRFVAHDKRKTGAICSFSRANHSFAHKKRANPSFALSLTKNRRFALKTDERVPNPEHKYSTSRCISSFAILADYPITKSCCYKSYVFDLQLLPYCIVYCIYTVCISFTYTNFFLLQIFVKIGSPSSKPLEFLTSFFVTEKSKFFRFSIF